MFTVLGAGNNNNDHKPAGLSKGNSTVQRGLKRGISAQKQNERDFQTKCFFSPLKVKPLHWTFETFQVEVGCEHKSLDTGSRCNFDNSLWSEDVVPPAVNNSLMGNQSITSGTTQAFSSSRTSGSGAKQTGSGHNTMGAASHKTLNREKHRFVHQQVSPPS